MVIFLGSFELKGITVTAVDGNEIHISIEPVDGPKIIFRCPERNAADFEDIVVRRPKPEE